MELCRSRRKPAGEREPTKMPDARLLDARESTGQSWSRFAQGGGEDLQPIRRANPGKLARQSRALRGQAGVKLVGTTGPPDTEPIRSRLTPPIPAYPRLSNQHSHLSDDTWVMASPSPHLPVPPTISILLPHPLLPPQPQWKPQPPRSVKTTGQSQKNQRRAGRRGRARPITFLEDKALTRCMYQGAWRITSEMYATSSSVWLWPHARRRSG